jgi:hypothetical protein
MDYIEKHPEKPWDWSRISNRATMDFIEKHPDKPWDLSRISENPNLTMAFFEKYFDKPWDWSGISRFATMDFIGKHPDKPWDWSRISENPYIFNHVTIPCYRSLKFYRKTPLIENYERSFRSILGHDISTLVISFL